MLNGGQSRSQRFQIPRVPECDKARLQAARRPATNQSESRRQQESLAPNHKQNVGSWRKRSLPTGRELYSKENCQSPPAHVQIHVKWKHLYWFCTELKP